MNIHEVFPAKWIEPDDFAGKRFTLEIIGVTLEEVFNRQTNSKEKKLAVAFKGAKKRFLLNKTNASAIAEIVGSPDTDNWIGHSIVLRAGIARNQKPTIVVEAPPQTAPTPALQATGEGA